MEAKRVCPKCGGRRTVSVLERPVTLRTVRWNEKGELEDVVELAAEPDRDYCVRCGAFYDAKKQAWVTDAPLLKKELVRPLLERAAQVGLTFTYRSLSDSVERLHGIKVQHRFGLHDVLDEIHRECLAANEPLLTALVVREDTNIPGEGWWRLPGVPAGGPDYWRWKQAAVAVFDHWAKKRDR